MYSNSSESSYDLRVTSLTTLGPGQCRVEPARANVESHRPGSMPSRTSSGQCRVERAWVSFKSIGPWSKSS